MPSPEALRVLVVDDEALARQRLIDLLTKVPGVDIMEAGDGGTAVDIIESRKPDLVFLDIQMPGLSGLDVVQAVGADRMPLTVFVTAYNQHAVRAFEANALDYLLKPFSDERFEVTMARAHARLEEAHLRNFSQQLVKLINGEAGPGEPWDRLVIKSGGSTRFVKTADIDLIEAAGVYVNLHVAGKQVLYRAPLHVLAERLDPMRFVRVHRSAIVNIESIVQLDPMSHGEFEVTLKHGARTKVSRSYRGHLERRLGQAL